jgi:hypothetical protein
VRLERKQGVVVSAEFTPKELADFFSVSEEELFSWKELIPPSERDGKTIYIAKSAEEWKLWQQRGKVLATKMPTKAVQGVEEEGVLPFYAELAEDCPDGLTAEVWRSYGIIVLMQHRYNKMIGPVELAQRGHLVRVDEHGNEELNLEIAKKHMRLLTGLGLLRAGREGSQWEGQWEHDGPPEAFRKMIAGKNVD